MENRKPLKIDDGRPARQCSVPGFKLVENRHPAGYRRAHHGHIHASFHFSFHGGCIEYETQRVRESQLFTLSFQPVGHEHACRCSEDGLWSLSLELQDDWLSRLQEYSVCLDQPGSFQSPQIQWLVARLRNELAIMEPASSLAIEGLALELAVEASRRRLKTPEQRWPHWLGRAQQFIHAYYREPLSLGDVAAAADIHPVHLARTFRQYFQCTVGEYVRNRRIEFACQQISHANNPLPDIALAAGFYDQSQFTRAFKRVVGATPAEFRASLRAR